MGGSVFAKEMEAAGGGTGRTEFVGAVVAAIEAKGGGEVTASGCLPDKGWLCGRTGCLSGSEGIRLERI